ncbi:MAG: DUF349 domain-containing protein, partial [Bacteroidaceae bacterium]|nr:DUF349 domain-containing protein [Bacteroidaceae bacterium]
MESLDKETTAIEQSSEMIAENTPATAETETAQPEAVATENTPTNAEDETTQQEEVADDELPTPETKEEVVARVKTLSESPELVNRQEIDHLKQLFYKFHKAATQEAFNAHTEAGGTPETFVPPIDPLEVEFRQALQTIRDRRAAIQEEQERQKAENLQRKLTILERLQQLATTPEEANTAFNEFKALQTEWKEIKAVPAERATELWKNYQLYVEQFYDLLKLGHELRDYDFKKNLEVKTRLCEQAEALKDNTEVVQAFNALQRLHQEWKETGPVAKELRDEIWERFKAASTVVNKRHQEYFEAIKAREEENLARKTALCERLEALQTDQPTNSSEWDNITKQILELQAEWKTIGFAPQKLNQQIFERFRQGCDTFFQQKAKYYQQLKESLNENLAKKKALLQQAEALKDSTEWKTATDTFISLQKQWKEIGSVPRKYSDALWKSFV